MLWQAARRHSVYSGLVPQLTEDPASSLDQIIDDGMRDHPSGGALFFLRPVASAHEHAFRTDCACERDIEPSIADSDCRE